MTKKIYLDACIFVAHAHSKHSNHQACLDCLKFLQKINLELYSSNWAILEMRRVLVRDCGFSKERSAEIAEKYLSENKIEDLNIKWIDVDTNKVRDFKQFLTHLNNQMLDTKELAIADAIHNLIMSTNELKEILTFDIDDFGVIKEVIVMNPRVMAGLEIKEEK